MEFAVGFLPLWVAALALALDMMFGEPNFIWRRVPHPVVLFGNAITFMDRLGNRWRQQSRFGGRFNGSVAILILLVVAFGAGWILQSVLALAGLIGWIAIAAIGSVFIAFRSLHDHVRAVEDALAAAQMGDARYAVSMIVGRDPDRLDEAGIARASIESLSENYSDGVVAPLFWFCFLGLPGLFAYKMLNTADSMIGHRSEKYEHFGWASARLDDVANLIPARLTAMILAIVPRRLVFGNGAQAGGRERRSVVDLVRSIWRDAAKHRSPNAGWPEAAMALTLDIALSGPRIYGDRVSDEPYVNAAGRRDVGAAEISRALGFYWVSGGVLLGAITLLALVL